jgi:uncharacterized protein (TIRG00374 family)
MKLSGKIFFVIIIAICFYAVFLIFSDISQILDKITNFNLQYLPLILIIIPISWFALFARWHLLLKSIGLQIPLKQNMKIYFAGFALAVTPGKFGELVKSQLMKKQFDVPRTTTAPLVLVERLYDLVGGVAVAIIGIWSLGLGAYVIIGASIVLVLIFLLLRSKKLFDKFLKLFGKTKITSKFVEPLSQSYDSIQKSTRGKIVIFSSVLTMVYWLVESMGVYLIVISFGIDKLSYYTVMSTYASSLILGAASFIPGGIGITEGSMTGLFSFQGVEISSAFALVVIIRLFTIWYSVIVGFISLKLSGGFSMFLNSEKT